MVNNFEQIKKMLNFASEDDFYHLQIIKRKKEHPELGSNSYVVKTYYISSIEYLDLKKDEIINLCEFHDARACINLNRRSFEKIAFHAMQKIANQLMNRDFRSVRKCYESVCGANSNEPNKKWIVDIDGYSMDAMAHSPLIKRMVETIQNLQGMSSGEAFLQPVRTKSGFHLITSPFRLDLFKNEFPEIDVHKDNPTILYLK
jgi:hypothetical protein